MVQGVDTPIRQLLEQPPREVFTVSPDTSVLDALRILADEDIGVVLVLDDERLVGVLSERDYTRGVELAGRSARETRVDELMTRGVTMVTPDYTVEQCMAVMTAEHVRHLPVLDQDRVVGVISIRDLVRATVSHYEDIVRDLDRDRLYLRTEEAGYY
jgi:CBS domain-containing protein